MNTVIMRAGKISRILKREYSQHTDGASYQDAAIDILTDLMHYCTLRGLNTADCLRLARIDYRETMKVKRKHPC